MATENYKTVKLNTRMKFNDIIRQTKRYNIKYILYFNWYSFLTEK